MRYFERSMNRRKEIGLEITGNIGTVYRRLPGYEKLFLGRGSTSSVYRLGQMTSGLWAAIRHFEEGEFIGWDFDMKKLELERYCRNAEKLGDNDVNVPAFCIGVVYREKSGFVIPGIITQDLTFGGRARLVHNPTEDVYGTAHMDGKTIRIAVDLDGKAEPIDFQELKYFSDRNVIKVEDEEEVPEEEPAEVVV